ncbi:glycosyltransferase family 4 protein, partial [Serratia marcescens]
SYNFIIPKLIANSRAVLTVSQFAKNELEYFFNIPKERCHVIYNAASSLFHPKVGAKDSVVPEKYFLAVASQQYHKNFEGLIAAFACVPEQSGFKLKIVGAQHKNYQGVESIFASSSSVNNVEFLGRVDDHTLSELYRRAFAFVFPSFYEGFGIPPLEAQASGCPVIASSAAAMPEVLQDSVIYFDPHDRNSLVNALESAIENQSERQRYVEAGYKNVARFSWENSASCLNRIIKGLSLGEGI